MAKSPVNVHRLKQIEQMLDLVREGQIAQDILDTQPLPPAGQRIKAPAWVMGVGPDNVTPVTAAVRTEAVGGRIYTPGLHIVPFSILLYGKEWDGFFRVIVIPPNKQTKARGTGALKLLCIKQLAEDDQAMQDADLAKQLDARPSTIRKIMQELAADGCVHNDLGAWTLINQHEPLPDWLKSQLPGVLIGEAVTADRLRADLKRSANKVHWAIQEVLMQARPTMRASCSALLGRVSSTREVFDSIDMNAVAQEIAVKTIYDFIDPQRPNCSFLRLLADRLRRDLPRAVSHATGESILESTCRAWLYNNGPVSSVQEAYAQGLPDYIPPNIVRECLTSTRLHASTDRFPDIADKAENQIAASSYLEQMEIDDVTLRLVKSVGLSEQDAEAWICHNALLGLDQAESISSIRKRQRRRVNVKDIEEQIQRAFLLPGEDLQADSAKIQRRIYRALFGD